VETLILTRSDIASVVACVGLDALMDELIEALARVLSCSGEGIEVRPRSGFQYAVPAPGVLEWMPVMHAGRSVVIKVVAYNPRNAELCGLPTIVSTLSLYDARTGHLDAMCDGILPTAMRTGE
jgi:ornithine cyclodeaminase